MKGMQKAWMPTIAFAFATCPLWGHAQDAPENAAPKAIQMVSARAWLNKGIDAKKAKVGDAITAKLQEDVKIPGSVDLPRNTALLGHVDQVQPSENKSDSTIQVTFDKAQLKNGQQLAIKATIVQISAPPSSLRNQDMPTGASARQGPPSSSSAGSSGGLQSQPPQSTPRPATNVTPDMPESAQPSSQPQRVGGVELRSDIHQSNSGIFTAKKKNVHLDDGTLLQLAIAVVPPNTQVQ
jgi:hypothetical protein